MVVAYAQGSPVCEAVPRRARIQGAQTVYQSTLGLRAIQVDLGLHGKFALLVRALQPQRFYPPAFHVAFNMGICVTSTLIPTVWL